MKQPSKNNQPKKKKPESQQKDLHQNPGKPNEFQWAGWIVLLTSIIYYSNTIGNGHALDDGMVMTFNNFVKKGFGGIGGILTKDSLYGFIGGDNPLPGGRYRPLSLITFAIEWEFFGDNPAISHFINLALYAFSGWVLWLILNKFIFKTKPLIAFIAAMLFAIHPIHTEVVANIKSRDEILSLLGSLGALYYLFKYTEENQEFKYLIFSCLYFFLGLFAKENTIMYIAIMPLALFCFSKSKFKENVKFLASYLILAIIFIGIRASVIGSHHLPNQEIMNDPFLHATFSQKYSTIFLSLLFYIKLLFLPYPLSYDYSFNQIPLTSFTDWRVILSVVIYLFIFIWSVINIRKKSVIAFGILYYLITIFITSNLIFNIGAPMGERFLYMPSVGFCMIIAVLGYRGYEWLKLKLGKTVSAATAFGVSIVILVTSSTETIARNMNWSSDTNLYIHDVNSVPNSALALQHCGTAYINISDSVFRGHADSIKDNSKWEQYLKIADGYFAKSLKIYPQYADAYLNYGLSKLKEHNFDEAEYYWDSTEKYVPTHHMLKVYRNVLGHIYLDSANRYPKQGTVEDAHRFLQKCIKLIPDEPEVYYDLGGYYFTIHDIAKAKENWNKCLALKPDYQQAIDGLKAIGVKQ